MRAGRRRWLVRAFMTALLLFAVWRFATWPDAAYSVAFRPDEQHLVRHVLDGDTIELANGDRVRLIGVDTPEFNRGRPEPFAEEATRFTAAMVQGKVVRLKFDRERLDKYRRVLAFVYVDDRFLNEELILAGLATAETQYDYRSDLKSRFKKAEQEAKASQRGIWSLRPTP